MSTHPPVLKTIASLLLLTAASAQSADLRGSGPPSVSLLQAYCPIGANGNNIKNPQYNPAPYTPELALAPINYIAGSTFPGPNPRTISNVISGGTGANGQNGQTTDPTFSAWIYVFGQFLDHDIDLEETPLTNTAINIVIPAGDPVFAAGTSIAMTRDSRSPNDQYDH